MNRPPSSVLRLLSAALLLAGLLLLARAGPELLTARVMIEWETASEMDTAGFHLYRGETEAGPFTRLTGSLIPAANDPLTGARYVFTDTTAQIGRTYYYQLEDVDTRGVATRQGLVNAAAWPGGLEQALLAAALWLGAALVWPKTAANLPATGASNRGAQISNTKTQSHEDTKKI